MFASQDRLANCILTRIYRAYECDNEVVFRQVVDPPGEKGLNKKSDWKLKDEPADHRQRRKLAYGCGEWYVQPRKMYVVERLDATKVYSIAF